MFGAHLLIDDYWAAPHVLSLCVCVRELLIYRSPRLLTSLLSPWWWCEGMLSLTSAGLPCPLDPKSSWKPTDSTSPLISVQLPLGLQHTDMHAHIYKSIHTHTHTQWTNESPIWTPWARCSTDCTAVLLNGPWINIWQLTWQTVNFLPIFIFITHHMGPTVTFDADFILEPEMTARAGVKLVTLQCADWTQKETDGMNTDGSWDSSGSHFGLVGSGQWTIVGGDWDVKNEWVSSIGLWIWFHPGGGGQVRDCGR